MCLTKTTLQFNMTEKDLAGSMILKYLGECYQDDDDEIVRIMRDAVFQ